MQASSSQPRYPPAVQHVRRPSRPQSVLATLVEYREPESGMPVTPRARPTSLIMSAPAHGHMPRSIFPDVPASRRAATALSSTPAPVRQQPPISRRHTAYLAPAPMTAPPRREPRPLRSSPLAGPSLALSDDGTLTGSEESGSMLRFRPNRISSTPDIIGSTLMQLEGRTAAVASAPSSPTERSSALPRLTPDKAPVDDKTPPPPSPVKKTSRRLSLGFKRLSALPGLPKSDPADKPDAAASPTSTSPVKGPTVPPPVPSIPVWARPSYMPPPVSPTKEAPKSSAAAAPPREGAKSVGRRPSTAPSSGSAKSVHRRSALYGSHESIPSTADAPAPSTSRDPDVNWMSAAAAPRFSRLSLKANGVVLPLTAKEVRRRSTIRVPSGSNTSNTSDAETATLRSRKSATSLRSLAASFRTAAADAARTPMPPSPPFRRDASASSSSIASSAGSVVSDSDVPETPSLSLSRASSDSGLSVDAEGPRTPGRVDELGALRCGKEGEGEGVELRVNDVMVEIIGLRERERRAVKKSGASSVELTVEVSEAAAAPVLQRSAEGKKATAGVERKGTLKRVWRKLTGGSVKR